ncbi:WD40 repeat domain-containing protein [Actinosynnema sp. NPDC059797]
MRRHHPGFRAGRPCHRPGEPGRTARGCGIDGVDFDRADTYRTQLLNCTPPPNAGSGSFIAPSAHIARTGSANEPRLRHFTGDTSLVHAATWSPDGSRILTGRRIWDATTGQLIYYLTAPAGFRAWSPDGTRILTSSSNDIRVWNATGQDTGLTFAFFPQGELAVYNAKKNEIIGCTKEAWRWLGWNVVEDGRVERLPAETFYPLPLLKPLDS